MLWKDGRKRPAQQPIELPHFEKEGKPNKCANPARRSLYPTRRGKGVRGKAYPVAVDVMWASCA